MVLKNNSANKYSFFDNTFWYPVKNDWRDRIEVEIGDIKQKDFYPQLKILRWDNEVNISLRLIDFDNFSIKKDNEKIKLINTEKEVHFYEVENGYELEVVLKKKPQTNIIEFSLVDKDVEYFYQPKINDKNINQPENVIGSYAVYVKSEKKNIIGGKLYRQGKVGHLFRPQIVDIKGNKVWGELKIDNGILRIIIPEEFLSVASYPIFVDPTFGYTSVGTVGVNYPAVGSWFAGEDGTAESITFYGHTGGSPTTGVAIYNKSTFGLVEEHFFDSNISYSDTDWHTIDLDNTCSVNSSTNYILMAGNLNAGVTVWADVVSGAGYYTTTPDSEFDFHWDDPLSLEEINYKFSIYCTYTSTGNNLTKDLADSISVNDSIGKGAELAKADSISVSDAQAKDIGLNKSDTIAISDSIANKVEKNLSESVSVSDSISKEPQKNLSDTVNVSDSKSFSIGKNLSDFVSVSDSFSRVVNWFKEIADSISVNDEISISIGEVVKKVIRYFSRKIGNFVKMSNFDRKLNFSKIEGKFSKKGKITKK